MCSWLCHAFMPCTSTVCSALPTSPEHAQQQGSPAGPVSLLFLSAVCNAEVPPTSSLSSTTLPAAPATTSPCPPPTLPLLAWLLLLK